MSVTEHPVDSRLDPQAALELAQELVLISRAMFAQQLPATSARAISGVPGLGNGVPGPIEPAGHEPAPAPSLVAPAPGVTDPAHGSAALTPVAVPLIAVAEADESSDVPPVAPIAVPMVASVTGSAPDLPVTPAPPTVNLREEPAVVDSSVDYVPVPGVEAVPVPLVSDVQVPPPLEVAAVPTPAAVIETSVVQEPVPAPRLLHPNLAMLEEIGFLDE